MNKTEHHKKALLEALRKSLGIVTNACERVDVGRTTYYEWYNNDEDFRTKVDDLQNIALDFAESQLHKQIAKQSTAATILYLKTKGKKRGYIERQEITGADGVPTNFKIEIIDKTEDVRTPDTD